jgi:hypothetical protein
MISVRYGIMQTDPPREFREERDGQKDLRGIFDNTGLY